MKTIKKNKHSSLRLNRIFIVVILLGCVGYISLYTLEKYNTPTLVGKWESTETGEIILFNEDGSVTLENTDYTPKFQIISPSKMIYVINDKQFEMEYSLEGRALKWGPTTESLEVFKRR